MTLTSSSGGGCFASSSDSVPCAPGCPTSRSIGASTGKRSTAGAAAAAAAASAPARLFCSEGAAEAAGRLQQQQEEPRSAQRSPRSNRNPRPAACPSGDHVGCPSDRGRLPEACRRSCAPPSGTGPPCCPHSCSSRSPVGRGTGAIRTKRALWAVQGDGGRVAAAAWRRHEADHALTKPTRIRTNAPHSP